MPQSLVSRRPLIPLGPQERIGHLPAVMIGVDAVQGCKERIARVAGDRVAIQHPEEQFARVDPSEDLPGWTSLIEPVQNPLSRAGPASQDFAGVLPATVFSYRLQSIHEDRS